MAGRLPRIAVVWMPQRTAPSFRRNFLLFFRLTLITATSVPIAIPRSTANAEIEKGHLQAGKIRKITLSRNQGIIKTLIKILKPSHNVYPSCASFFKKAAQIPGMPKKRAACFFLICSYGRLLRLTVAGNNLIHLAVVLQLLDDAVYNIQHLRNCLSEQRLRTDQRTTDRLPGSSARHWRTRPAPWQAAHPVTIDAVDLAVLRDPHRPVQTWCNALLRREPYCPHWTPRGPQCCPAVLRQPYRPELHPLPRLPRELPHLQQQPPSEST